MLIRRYIRFHLPSGSNYNRAVRRDMHAYARWHAFWHTAFPIWCMALGYYTNFVREEPPADLWYPDPYWSFFGPLLVLWPLVWCGRRNNSRKDSDLALSEKTLLKNGVKKGASAKKSPRARNGSVPPKGGRGAPTAPSRGGGKK